MSSGIHRKRLACVECTRRKIKCDKTLPCRNCTRKGSHCRRPRARDSPGLNVSSAREHSETSGVNCSGIESSKLIESLRERIGKLETALTEAKETASRQTPSSQLSPSIFSTREPSSCQPIATSDTESITSSSLVKATSEVEDAATILEFLAWGRRKDPSYQDEIAKRNDLIHSPGDIPIDDDWDNGQNSAFTAANFCELLLPAESKVHELVNYHCECLLWYHGAFHATTFIQQLNDFYDTTGGRVEEPKVSLQWMALLFAILTGAIASAPLSATRAWGFRDQEKNVLSHRWLKASMACLHQADYMACHSIFSVQSIATLTISAHMLGKSNSFSVLLASAVRIAQGLGLHQLDGDSRMNSVDPISKEIGRRIWCQLCIQDWFSIPFTESYLIHPICFNTERPQNCDNDPTSIPDDFPTVAGYSRLFYNIAALMPGLYDDMNSSNTLYTRYEEVLKYDRRLRTLATQHLPLYLQNVPLDPRWPRYVPWARRSLAISSAHKVIMIHRKFLSRSFGNPMFEFTRKTCVAASRTIIKEQKEATREDGPLLWIHQAFSVTASVSNAIQIKSEDHHIGELTMSQIILCLDMFHQPATDHQSSENRQFIEDGISILSHYDSDMIARRGVSIIKSMLRLEDNRCRFPGPFNGQMGPKAGTGFDIATIIETFYKEYQNFLSEPLCDRLETRPRQFSDGNWPGMVINESSPVSGEELLLPHGINYTESLDDILNLATNYLN